MCDDLTFLKKLVNLKHLDISNNVDMYKPKEMLQAEAKKMAEGSDCNDFDFLCNKRHRDEILHNIPSVEHLECDLMLEFYILDTREARGFLPNLKTINKIPIDKLKGLEERSIEKKILELMNGVWKLCNSYRLVKPGKMDEEPTFYINDEVGCSICHSDQPNTKMSPLIYSPNCEPDDSQTMTYSVVWATKDIKNNEYLYRDYLHGIDETKWRSAKLLPWFNVFEEYF